MATYPSLVMAQQLAEVVKARLGLATVVGQDANGDPTIAIGTGSTNTASAFVRIKARNATLPFDVVGHAQPQYGRPHKAEILLEAAATSLGIQLVQVPLFTTLAAELARVGVRMEVFVTAANGTLPTLANLNLETTVDASWDDLYYPISAGM